MLPTHQPIIATSTLAIPVMIINETFLSFLGLGLRPPAISWGVLLQEAQNLQSVPGSLAVASWLGGHLYRSCAQHPGGWL